MEAYLPITSVKQQNKRGADSKLEQLGLAFIFVTLLMAGFVLGLELFVTPYLDQFMLELTK